jgi:arylsulfatase A-like enzyme
MRINRKKFYRPWKQSRGDVNLVVREGPWKAIWNVEPGTVELYDLSLDPKEARNVAAEHPERAERLRQFAERWYRECAGRAVAPRPTAGAPDQKTVERLRQLGYAN